MLSGWIVHAMIITTTLLHLRLTNPAQKDLQARTTSQLPHKLETNDEHHNNNKMLIVMMMVVRIMVVMMTVMMRMVVMMTDSGDNDGGGDDGGDEDGDNAPQCTHLAGLHRWRECPPVGPPPPGGWTGSGRRPHPALPPRWECCRCWPWSAAAPPPLHAHQLKQQHLL